MGGRRAGRVSAGNMGGAKYFFCSGPKFPPRHPKDNIFEQGIPDIRDPDVGMSLTPGIVRDNNLMPGTLFSWWTFRMFFIFLSAREGEGGVRARRRGGGSVFLLKIPGGGVGEFQRGRGREGVCGKLGNFFGGGGIQMFFLSGPKRPPSSVVSDSSRQGCP